MGVGELAPVPAVFVMWRKKRGRGICRALRRSGGVRGSCGVIVYLNG